MIEDFGSGYPLPFSVTNAVILEFFEANPGVYFNGKILYLPVTETKKEALMRTTIAPNKSEKDLRMTHERLMKASAAEIYEAWTERFDLWFAQPGELIMKPEVDTPFFFYNLAEWGRHPHYGRFTELEKDKLIEMAWSSNPLGTKGAETLIRIELEPREEGTMFRMTHSGFADEESCQAHKDAWPAGLDYLEEKLRG